MKITSTLLAICTALASLPAIARPEPKPDVVLVHGAFETAAIWNGVEVALRHDGYCVLSVDLPGRPGSPEHSDAVSLDVYRRVVLEAINKARRPVILVGHSFGGIIISSVADAAPEKVRTLVYVAALLPRDGDSLLSLATADPGSQVAPHLIVDKANGIASIAEDARGELFANDADAGVQAVVAKAVVPEPLAPLAEPIHLSGRLAGVDKVYVHTARDQVVSPAGQAAMVAATPVRKEVSLDTGHTPFVTNPAALVAAIEQATM
ncbi:pimeloyl-ACP methyl ester carboxylesterase [Sphingomonas trueperi]|uniref:alpha/beta fold hydrolase n=1 Tax=Sphingomonas trueperi TaxID=53317 RepID=UPI00339B3589